MNVMLVDSDPENIRNFRTHIKAAYPNHRIVGSFSDAAKDIMTFIRDWAPQLIIADIKFFGGVRFMRFKEIHEEFPEIRFIVYGTYNEADYMKRAREFGVIDFMYRPVKPAELNRCLAQAVEHFRKAEEKVRQTKVLAQNYQERIFQYEEIFLRALLEGSIANENEIRAGFFYFNIPFDQGFSVVFFRIDHFRTIALTLEEQEKHLLIFKIQRIVQDALRDYSAQPFIRGFHEIAVILNGHHSIHEKVMLADKIKHQIYEQANTRMTAGIGRTYDNPTEIPVSAREADAAFRYRYSMGYNAVIPIEFVEPTNTVTYRYPIEREQRLVHAVAIGDYEYSRQVLKELFDALSRAGTLPEHLIANIVMAITFGISRYLSEQNLPVAAQVTRYFPITDILKLTALDDGFTFMEKSMKKFCAFIAQHRAQWSEQLHQSAKEYIRGHFHEHFSIAKIALNLNTTPENLNKVFMEKERVMLFDYVMYVRVSEAQHLLKDTDLEEETVAVRIGFDDVKYFRSIFRKYIGETPAEYRLRERSKQQAPPADIQVFEE
jgi:two-component system response regulator YesN